MMVIQKNGILTFLSNEKRKQKYLKKERKKENIKAGMMGEGK